MSMKTGFVFIVGRYKQSTLFVGSGLVMKLSSISRPSSPYCFSDSTTVIVDCIETLSDSIWQFKSPIGFIRCPSYAVKRRLETLRGGRPIFLHILVEIIVAAAPVSTSMTHVASLILSVSFDSALCVGIVSICRRSEFESAAPE